MNARISPTSLRTILKPFSKQTSSITKEPSSLRRPKNCGATSSFLMISGQLLLDISESMSQLYFLHNLIELNGRLKMVAANWLGCFSSLLWIWRFNRRWLHEWRFSLNMHVRIQISLDSDTSKGVLISSAQRTQRLNPWNKEVGQEARPLICWSLRRRHHQRSEKSLLKLSSSPNLSRFNR